MDAIGGVCVDADKWVNVFQNDQYSRITLFSWRNRSFSADTNAKSGQLCSVENLFTLAKPAVWWRA